MGQPNTARSKSTAMRKAYTLVELLVTISVLALLAAFVVPSYMLIMSQAQLNTAVSEVSNLLRYNEQKTVTEQKTYGLTFSAGSGTIPIFIKNVDNSKTAQPTYTLPVNIVLGAVNFSGSSDVLFTNSGAPNVSGSFVLTDTVRNKSRLLTVKPSGEIVANTGEY